MKKSIQKSASCFFSVIAAVLLIPGAALASTEVAKVNGKIITLEDFNKKYSALLPLYQNKTPTKAAVLEDLIKRELGIQEAKRLKLDQDPAVI